MKKATINMLKTALVLFILGILICAASFIFATITKTDLFADYKNNSKEIINFKIEDIASDNLLPFSKINITSESSDVIIKNTTDKSWIEIKNADSDNTEYSLENGVLKIVDKDPFFFMGISIGSENIKFSGYRSILNKGFASKRNKLITIHINEKEKIESISVLSGVGNVEIFSIDCVTLKIVTKVGKIDVKNSAFLSTLKASTSCGNIEMENNSYLLADLSTTLGNIEAHVSTHKTNCETRFGDISIFTYKNPTDYNIRLSKTKGSIKVNGDICENKEYLNSISGIGSIWGKTYFGNINVNKTITI